MKTHPLELLTRVATAEPGQVYEHVLTQGKGHKSKSVLGAHETRSANPGNLYSTIMGGMAGLNDVQASILYLKYGSGGDHEWLRVLRSTVSVVNQVYTEKQALRKKRGQQEIDSGTLTRIAVSAVAEYIQTRACSWCKGTREIWEGQKRVDCPDCGGNGMMDWTAERRARYMGISRSGYYRLVWLYTPAMRHLKANEADGLTELKRRLK